MASKREEKRDDGEEEEEDDEDDISGSEGEGESESDEEMSESESDGDSKATKADKGGKPGSGGVTKAGSERALVNQPFDEALDLSESDSGSVAEGLDSPKKAAKQFKNLPFDEALELSGSVQDLESPQKAAPAAVGRKESPPPGSGDRTGSGSMAAATAKPSGSAGGSAGAKGTPSALTPGAGQEVKNNPFDEEVDLSDSGESVDTNGHPSPDRSSMKAKSAAAASAAVAATPKQAAAAPTPAATAHVRRDDKSQQKPAALEERKQPTPAAKPAPMAQKTESAKKAAPEPSSKKKHDSDSSSEESGSEEDEDDDDEEDEGEESASAAGPGASAGTGASSASSQSAIMANAGSYKESDFAHLKVSGEVRELFQYIGRFKSQEIELETRLKCFIPEYIPAVGDMDAFLKIPRPDGELDNLGLKMLDEPSLTQSDATVLDLQLRSTSKKKHGDIVVRSIENAEKAPKEIDRWVKSIADLHRTKPPPQVHYTKTMPDIESLMQVWPEEFEELLGKTALPSASMDMALEQYVRVICALLDIPVHKNVYESLHVLFTLYLEFRSNQHFMNYDEQLELAAAQQQQLPAYGGNTARRGGDEMQMMDEYSSRK